MLDHGELLATQNRKTNARESLELGTIAAELTLEKAPDDAARRFLLAKMWRCLADVQAGQREHPEAVRSVERAIEVLKPLASTEPDQTSNLVELSAAYYRRAVMETGPGAHEREVNGLQKSIDLAERVMQSSSDDSANRLRLAIALRSLARSLAELNRADEAWAASERHGKQLERMAQHKDLIPPDEFRNLARAYHRRGLQLNAAGEGEAAATVFAKGATAFEKAAGFKFGVIDILLWGECHYFLARHSESVDDKPAAIEHYERAVELLKEQALKRDANVAIKDRYRRSVAALEELNTAAAGEPVSAGP
jgi:tetratricopeptide (TPR) repeat protein